MENEEVNFWKPLMICLFAGLASIIILFTIDEATAPKTTYKIIANDKTYWANSYTSENGFITIPEYYDHKFVTWLVHKSITLQGNIVITELK
jgi:hypothetical protein